jgi:hypothetical protein
MKILSSLLLAILILLARPVVSQETGPLVELSRPNAVGSCDTGWSARFIASPPEDAHEPVVAVNPIHPNNVVAAWSQGAFQNIIGAFSFDGGQRWQQVPIPLTVCSGGSFLGTWDPWLSFAPNGDLYISKANLFLRVLPNNSEAPYTARDSSGNWGSSDVLPN